MRRMTYLARLDRSVLRLEGADRVAFLQGLISNDVTEVAPGRAVYAALLTPQGKYLADFFVIAAPDAPALLLDCATSQAPLVAARLNRYRLRADARITPMPPEWGVTAAWGEAPPQPPAPGVRVPDPRLAAAGWRLVTPEPVPGALGPDAYDTHRLALGLPEGTRDLEPERSVLLEAWFDRLNGVSWTKGCFMGQELTARTRYRGLVKRLVVKVVAEAALPPPGTPILRADEAVGTLHAGRGAVAMATLRSDALDDPLVAAGVRLRVDLPPWARVAEDPATG